MSAAGGLRAAIDTKCRSHVGKSANFGYRRSLMPAMAVRLDMAAAEEFWRVLSAPEGA